jgi:hypothetical protein
VRRAGAACAGAASRAGRLRDELRALRPRAVGTLAAATVDRPEAPVPHVNAGRGAWVVVSGGRIVLGRGGRVLWRSTGGYRPLARPRVFRAIAQDAQLGARVLAFSVSTWRPGGVRHTLYVAPLDGAERVVAHGEWPLGWTVAGLLTASPSAVRLRASDGRLLRRLPVAGRDETFDRPLGRLVFRTGQGRIGWTDGRKLVWFAPASVLGVRAETPWLQPARDGVLVASPRRIVEVGWDGRRRLTVDVPAGLRYDGAPVVPDRVGRLAFTADAARGIVAVVSATPGSPARRLFRAGTQPVGPLRVLAWHRGWVLYATGAGRAAALDARDRRAPVDLTAAIRSVPGGVLGPTVGGAATVLGARWGR